MTTENIFYGYNSRCQPTTIRLQLQLTDYRNSIGLLIRTIH